MNSESSKKRSVILLSGGLDSSVNLALCAERDLPVLALTCDYGQRAAKREIEAAEKLSEYYQVPHQNVDLGWLGSIGGSSLTEVAQEIPTLTKAELEDEETTRRTGQSVWVPNRNGVLINVAAAFAERWGADRVVVGFNREEAATFPDNSIEFIKRANEALLLSTANQVQLYCYTADLDKRQIVREAESLSRPFPFEWIWSCYHGGARPCGQCESCIRMARALEARNRI